MREEILFCPKLIRINACEVFGQEANGSDKLRRKFCMFVGTFQDLQAKGNTNLLSRKQ